MVGEGGAGEGEERVVSDESCVVVVALCWGVGMGMGVEADRSGPFVVGETSDCNGDGRVGSICSAIGLFVLGLLACKSMLQSARRCLYRACGLDHPLSWPRAPLAESCDAQRNTRMHPLVHDCAATLTNGVGTCSSTPQVEASQSPGTVAIGAISYSEA